MLSAELTNLSETEAIIALEHLTLNGLDTDARTEAYGSGDNWGLLPGETQYLQAALPLDTLPVTGSLTDITFDLSFFDAANDNAIGTVPVTVTLLLNIAAE